MKKPTCYYCGRERKRNQMTPSLFKSGPMAGKLICKSDVTTCLRIRAGAVFERNARG